MVVITVYLFIVALFVLLGITFALGKDSFLIAGYNTLPEKEKLTKRLLPSLWGK